MIGQLKSQVPFYLLLLLWVIAGIFGGVAVYAVIPLVLILLRLNERYQEIFLGFIIILVLSDSLETQLEFAKSFKNINIVLLFIFFLSDLRNFQPVNKLFIVFVPFFITAIICIFYAETNFNAAIQKTLSYILLFISVPNYVVKNYKENGVDFLRNLMYVIFLVLVAGYLLSFVWPNIPFSHGGRLRGLFGNPNGLGIFCIMIYLLFALIDSKFESAFSRQEKLLFYALIIVSLILTGSRTALLAVLLFIIFRYIYNYSPFLGFITFLVTILVTEYIVTNFVSIVQSLGLGEYFRIDTIEAGSGRIVAWGFAWENIQKSLFVGKGFAFDEYLMRSHASELAQLGHEGGVHNTYLIIWLNTGLIGLLFFIRGFLLMFIKAAQKSRLAFPIFFTVLFSINFEPWLAASLNPYTILFLVIITVLTDEAFDNENSEISDEIIRQQNEETPQMA